MGSRPGGAIFNERLSNIPILNKVQIFNSTAQNNGGGIYNALSATLVIQNSTFKTAKAVGGSGGGIYNLGNPTINQCTFNGCTAAQKGGAILDLAGIGTGRGNTINGNRVTGLGGQAGFGPPDSSVSGGGISVDPSAAFYLINSIVAGNSAPLNNNNDVDGNFNDQGHNFIGDGTGGNFINGTNGDQVGDSVNPLDPMLGSLQDNGGGIETQMPFAGSPVIDAGDNSYAPATDARGFQRIVNLIVDIGAVEYGAIATQTGTHTTARPPGGAAAMGAGLYTNGGALTFPSVAPPSSPQVSLFNIDGLETELAIALGRHQRDLS